jgi:hypothetical protein
MTGRDRIFGLGVLTLSAVAVPALLALRPFDEARATLGLVGGWAAALLVVVPSYVWLARVLTRNEPHAFVRGFMASTTLRLFIALALLVGFALLVQDAPVGSFVTSFMLGYVALTALELWLLLRPARGKVSA